MNSGQKSIAFVMPFHISERGGGAEVQTWLMARELARRGFPVFFIAQSVSGKAGTRETLEGVELVWLPYVHHFRWRACRRYYHALLQLSPDVVVVRVTSYLVGVAGHYRKKKGGKFVWMCADNLSPLKWHALAKQREYYGSMHFKQLLYAYFNALVGDLIRIYGDRFVTHALTQNEVQREAYKRAFGTVSQRLVSGHEPPASLRSPLKRLQGGIVLWVANIGHRKRPEKFVELARACEGGRLSFVMIGERSDGRLLDEIFSGQPANLQWLGKLSFEETLTWFDQAAFFVNTSISSGEGFPNTYIQAWLRGVPTFCLGADPDGVTTENGLGCVVEDVDGLAAAISRLANDPAGYEKICTRVLKFAQENYTVFRAVDKLLENIGLQSH